MEDSTRNGNAPGREAPATTELPEWLKQATNHPTAQWQQIRAHVRSLSDKDRSDLLIFLTGYFAPPSAVYPETREFWSRVATAVKELAKPPARELDLEAFTKKLNDRNERFNQLIQGPLSHPLFLFRFIRMMSALFSVAMSSDQAWQALEDHCLDRQRRDMQDAAAEEGSNVPVC